MILADENIDDQITEAIRAIGIEVYSIAETHSGIDDEEIIELSKRPPRIILTEADAARIKTLENGYFLMG